MKIKLIREIKTDLSSVGSLYINDKYFCKTLEPFDAGLNENSTLADIYEAKHARKCAIPTGAYTLAINQVSPRFGKIKPYSDFGGIVPRYEGVKGFAGVLIHIGNFPKDTDGCTLVGRYAKKDAITDSKVTFIALMKMLLAVPKVERIYITVERDYK
jgi:hypothetical protein